MNEIGNTEEMEEIAEQYLEIAYYGLKTLYPILLVVASLLVVVLTIPFFLIGAISKTVVWTAKFTWNRIPTVGKELIFYILFYQYKFVLSPPVPKFPVGGQGRQTDLSEYND